MHNCSRLRILFHPPKVASMITLSSLINEAGLHFGGIYVMTKLGRMASTATGGFLVRHGVTVLGAEDRFAGATDVALSDEGREQTRRLAERLSDEKIVAVYASPLGRTVETAQILAAPHKLEVQTRDGFREISHGRWEQMTRREVEEKFPEEAAEWEKDPYTFAPVGGESGLAVTARALPALIELVRTHPGENILVVSHKATIRL